MKNNYFIDLVGNKLTFPDSRFYKTEEGVWVPSVTTINDAYPKGPGFYEWLKKAGDEADNIRDAAGDRGSVVHHLSEDYDNGFEVSILDDFGNVKVSMREWNMFEKYVQYRKRLADRLQIEFVELHVSSTMLGYAGTMDRIVKIDGRRYILDTKTSNSIYPHYWNQLAAYRELWEEKQKKDYPVDGVGILWLNAKTKGDGRGDAIQGQGWQLLLQEDTSHELDLFHATHKLWLAENKNLQPKEFIYNLKHRLPEMGPE